MVQIYVQLIRKNIRTLDSVPENIRELVRRALEEV